MAEGGGARCRHETPSPPPAAPRLPLPSPFPPCIIPRPVQQSELSSAPVGMESERKEEIGMELQGEGAKMD